MTPLSIAHTELHLFVQQVEEMQHAQRLLDRQHCATGLPVDASRWEDHRAAATGALWDTLDRVEPGLGLRLMRALYDHFEPGDDALDVSDASFQRAARLWPKPQ